MIKPNPTHHNEPFAAPPAGDHPGDMSPEAFRAALHEAADLAADYFAGVRDYPVLPKVKPGDIRAALPEIAPEQPETLAAVFNDYKQIIESGTTHWNHPGFMAYFAVTGSGPGIMAEMLAATLNVNAMLWRTGPAPTELEEVACDWLRQGIGLPDVFKGHINDTASVGSLIALAAARHRQFDLDIRRQGMAGRELPRLTVYASEQAHSSIDKACVTLGIGLDNLRKIPTDDDFRMDPKQLAEAIAADRASGALPIAVVATVGTTSTTSVDPVPAIAETARRENLWLHVDGAYAVTGAIVPELREQMPGLELADSIVTNPHKWLFVPVDCSVLFMRDPALLRAAFSIVPDYLTTSESGVTNLMDYGVQLGRRFRALKLWMVLRAFGLEGLRERMRFHCRLAREFAGWVVEDARCELVAPVPMSTVCFRMRFPDARDAQHEDALNEQLLQRVNARGPVFISHTKLRGRYVMRLCVGNLRTTIATLETAWTLLHEEYQAVADEALS